MFEFPGRNQKDNVKVEHSSAGLRFEYLNTQNTPIIPTTPINIINE